MLAVYGSGYFKDLDDVLHDLSTSELQIAYEATGDSKGDPVLILHGWPDSVRSWHTVAGYLNAQDKRCYRPYLRGFGATRFSAHSSRRSGQATALAQDAIEFADALGLERFTLVGHDWGAFAAYLLAARWPQRVTRLITLSVGYGINEPVQVVDIEQARRFWYQWFFQTEQGHLALEHDRSAFCRQIWQQWLAPGAFDQTAFEQAASAWQNPDWVTITLHYYRHRWGSVLGEPRYRALEQLRLYPPRITVPTVLIHGQQDRCVLPKTVAGKDAFFSNGYRLEQLPGVGHFPHLEAPEQVAEIILE